MPSHDEEVLTANELFYEAFRARDSAAMAALWAREHVVACIHPGLGALYGREQVMASWRAILGNEDAPSVQCDEARAFVFGETAFVTCVEHIENAELAATNVFAREPGGWKLIHHQAGPMNRRVDTTRMPAMN